MGGFYLEELKFLTNIC